MCRSTTLTRIALAAVLASALAACGGAEGDLASNDHEIRPERASLELSKADGPSWARLQTGLLGCPGGPAVVQRVSGHFSGYDSADLYRMRGNGQQATLELDGSYAASLGAAIAVYDDNGQRVASDRKAQSNKASVSFQSQKEDYFVAVYTTSLFATGSYTVTISCDSTPPPPPPIKRCGGFLGLICDSNEYCDYPRDSCGYADQMGVCKVRPQACTREYRPVCGCNGQTYSNACGAYAAGVDKHHDGACNAPEPKCHTLTEAECAQRDDCQWKTVPGFPGPLSFCEDKQAPPPPPPPPAKCHTLTKAECDQRDDCQWKTRPGFPGPISSCEEKQVPPPPPPPQQCYVGGCSSEVCSDKPGVVSACIWKPEFDCVKYSKCGPYGPGGKCGWQQTSTYLQCMMNLLP